MSQAEFSGAIAAVAVVLMAGSALAANECARLPHAGPHNALGDFFGDVAAGMNPELREQQQRGIAARATYEALLAAGAPETLACAAALNPQVFQTVGPMYLRPSR
jgi:hypothetical protein